MKYRLLGRTGLYVSELCLGTMTFGDQGFWKVMGGLGQEAVNGLVRNAFDAGVNGKPSALATGSQVIWPFHTLRPLAKCGSSASARFQPLSAIASTNGRVALLSAWVEVFGTPPGMLATQ